MIRRAGDIPSRTATQTQGAVLVGLGKVFLATSSAMGSLASFGGTDSIVGQIPRVNIESVSSKGSIITGIGRFLVEEDSPARTLHAALDRLASLPSGWDGEDAEVPNATALAHAKYLLHLLIEWPLLPSRIIPCIDGGVTFLFYNGPKLLAVEILNSGEIAYAISAGPGRTTAGELIPSDQAFRQLIEEISAGIA